MWTEDWYFERRSASGTAKVQQVTQDFHYLIRQLRAALAEHEEVEVRLAADATPEQIEQVRELARVA